MAGQPVGVSRPGSRPVEFAAWAVVENRARGSCRGESKFVSARKIPNSLLAVGRGCRGVTLRFLQCIRSAPVGGKGSRNTVGFDRTDSPATARRAGTGAGPSRGVDSHRSEIDVDQDAGQR